MTLSTLSTVFALTLAAPASAGAAPEASASGDVSLSRDGADATSETSDRSTSKRDNGDSRGWMRRYAPERNMMEIGVFGGIFITSKQHELYDYTKPWERYKRIAPDIGARFAYYPLSFLGIEAEGAVMPTRTASEQSALLYGLRAHVIAQLPRRISPFLLAGVGALGASSDSLGRDIDPALHFGGGVKFFVNRYLALRLDIRDNVGAAVQLANGRTNYIELLVGASLTLGRAKPNTKNLLDSDGDGLFDPGQGLREREEDACPNQPGPASNRGCPLIDSDGDGLYDPGQNVPAEQIDACPNEPGPKATQGCPLVDSDRDGLFDPGQGLAPEEEDKCPAQAGPRETQGCPILDTDNDGIADPGQGVVPEDQCPTEPETDNDYQDEDGCPDEIPKAVKKFTGAIRGINFDVDKDTIKPNSTKTLSSAVKVLKDFPDVRIEISGHTDADGSRDHNLDLSKRRAAAVKRYLVDAGIAAGRIETRGAGPDEPIADNGTRRGKAENRRIEFKLLKGAMSNETR